MQTTRVILVGGFLGAGKTTLLAQAAERLTRQGKRVGLVANDQAADLVDTALLKDTGTSVEEVAGGCFCCRFPDMIAAMERLARDAHADVLIGEPVGSCTDLSATVMQPLKRLHGHQFDVAPFSVLVDGNQVRVLARLRQAAPSPPVPLPKGERGATFGAGLPTPLAARFPDNVLYIYHKQLEEADLIVLNKADLLSPGELEELKQSLAEQFPGTPVLVMSALSGAGVDEWLAFLSRPRPLGCPAGHKIAEVDYDTYAAGEAALGWMNAAARLHARETTDWKAFAGELLEAIRGDLRSAAGEIAHLKLYLTVPGGHIVGNVTSNSALVSIRGQVAGDPRAAKLLLNARVHVQPDALRAIVERALQSVAGERIEATVTNMRSFFPGRPEPTHRFERVV